jgi:hypothetical protein
MRNILLFFYLLETGYFFSAKATKRTNGEEREFNGVVTDVDPEQELALIWDRYAGNYRYVNLSKLHRVSAFGDTFTFA